MSRTRAEIDLMREGGFETMQSLRGRGVDEEIRFHVAALFPYPKEPRVWMRSDGRQFRLNEGKWEIDHGVVGWALYDAIPSAFTEADARTIVDLYDNPWESE